MKSFRVWLTGNSCSGRHGPDLQNTAAADAKEPLGAIFTPTATLVKQEETEKEEDVYISFSLRGGNIRTVRLYGRNSCRSTGETEKQRVRRSLALNLREKQEETLII